MAINCGCKGSSNSLKHSTLFLIILLFSTRACCQEHPHVSKRINCLENERKALLTIKSNLYNSHHWLSSWTDYNCCKWRRVACDNTTNHVIRLDLRYPIDQYDLFSNRSKGNQISREISWGLSNLIHLEYLDLSWNRIIGEIPLSMSNLTSLLYLDMSHNKFFGYIPDALGNLISLVHLDVSYNEFYGRIPNALGNLTSLVHLDVSYNEFYGRIPNALGNLTSLVHLDVSSNEFYGHIPDALGNLVYLEELRLSYNNISGQIPENIGRLHNLMHFQALTNNLMGQLPLSLDDLCNLEFLDLSSNNIGGQLTNLLDGLSKCPQGSKLRHFNIYGNKFSGSIPFSLGQLAKLDSLYISSNSLKGNMTDAHFSKLTNLKILDTSYNSLNLILSDDWIPPFQAEWIDMSYCHLGTRFPSWIRTQTTLKILCLSGVGLYGNIPHWFSDIIFNNSYIYLDVSSNNLNGQLPSSLSLFMDLSNNSFEGTIPLSYAKFKHVEVLKLSNNQIHGSFPAFFCNLTNLYVLHLSNNYLSGEVPNCHGSYLIGLHSLHMDNNNFSGLFPSFLKNCTELVVLDLGGNKFSDAIPKWVGRIFPMLRFLRLSSNSFHGAIPASIGDLASLQVLDLSFNKFTGGIPSTVANLSSMSVNQNYTGFLHFGGDYSGLQGCKSCYLDYFLNDNIIITAKGLTIEYTKALSVVTSIDLSNNELSSDIPKEITKLHGLYFLNLSNNHLTGNIPDNIGAMTELQSLDLSMNHLTGEIPLNLSSLTFLSSLNLSYNNLSGRIPTGGQFSTFNDLIYVGNEGLCGVPLPECPSDDTNHQIGENEDSDKFETILNYTFIVMGFIAGFWVYFGLIIMKKSIKVALFQLVDNIYDRMYVQLLPKIAKLNMKWQK